MLLDQLRCFVDEVKSGLFTPADVAEARLLLDELELTWLGALGEADSQGIGSEQGARSTAAWLSLPTVMQRSEAAGRVKFSRKLRSMPTTTEAVRDGRLSLSQARILSRGLTPRTVEAFGESEATLVQNAAGLNATQTEYLVLWWLRAADPDGADQHDRDGEEARRFTVRETLPGEWWIDGRCTAEQAEVLNRAVDALVSSWLRNSDDTRTVSQMRIDALVEVCRQWLTSGETPSVRDERPHVHVNIDLDSLLWGDRTGSFDNQSPVPGDVTSEFLCDCVITRIMSRGSIVLDVGRAERLVTSAQRKAITKRDGCCRFPGCDRAPSQCDVHHVVEWLHGGPTDLSNLVLLCRFHHRVIHKHHLKAELDPDAVFHVWDLHGNEMRSVPPPDVGAIVGRHPRNKPPSKLRTDQTIDGLSDVDMRQRVRDAIARFQYATNPPGDDEVREINLARQRVAALRMRSLARASG